MQIALGSDPRDDSSALVPAGSLSVKWMAFRKNGTIGVKQGFPVVGIWQCPDIFGGHNAGGC